MELFLQCKDLIQNHKFVILGPKLLEIQTKVHLKQFYMVSNPQNITSAKAIQPLPEVMLSVQYGT